MDRIVEKKIINKDKMTDWSNLLRYFSQEYVVSKCDRIGGVDENDHQNF